MRKKKLRAGCGSAYAMSKEMRKMSAEVQRIGKRKREYREAWILCDMRENELRGKLRAQCEEMGVDYDALCARNRRTTRVVLGPRRLPQKVSMVQEIEVVPRG